VSWAFYSVSNALGMGYAAPFTYRIHPSRVREVVMAKSQKRSNREKKKPKQDKNKKGGEAPSQFAVKLGTSYMSQYGKKH
jgi:hypothetical protein